MKKTHLNLGIHFKNPINLKTEREKEPKRRGKILFAAVFFQETVLKQSNVCHFQILLKFNIYKK